MKEFTKDILKVAQEVVAGSGLSFLSEKREKKANDYVEMLKRAIEKEHIWNVNLKAAKEWLSWSMESARESLMTPIREEMHEIQKRLGDDYRGNEEYDRISNLYWELPSSMVSINKFQRNLKDYKWYKNYNDLEKFAEEWVEVKQLIKDVKPFIEKGRKPSGKPSNVYQPPLSNFTPQAMKVVNEALNKILDKNYNEYVDALIEQYERLVDRYFEERTSERQDPGKIFGTPSYETDIVRSLTEKARNDEFNYVYTRKSNYDSLTKKYATAQADAMKEQFIEKNLKKLVSVVAKKELDKATVLGGRMGGGLGFEGRIKFEFTDGTSFVVLNQLVVSWGYRGTIYRFPTTFHDVVFSDGTTKKKRSEKQMNEDWN